MKRAAILTLTFLASAALAGERFIATIGTVQKEIAADSLAMTLGVSATEKTIEESVASLNKLLDSLGAEMAALRYPSNALTVKERKTKQAWEWDGQKKVHLGFASEATVGVSLRELTNYSKLLTYLGPHEAFDIAWMTMSGSAEGAVRRSAVGEALEAARAKAALLAQDGGQQFVAGPLHHRAGVVLGQLGQHAARQGHCVALGQAGGHRTHGQGLGRQG